MNEKIIKLLYTKTFAIISLLIMSALLFAGSYLDYKIAQTIGAILLGFNIGVAFTTGFWQKKY